MAKVERIRSFIAIDIGPEVRAALVAISRELARAGADARWVRPEGMHATLKFLGGVEPTRLQAVRHAVDQVATRHAAMKMSVRGLGTFPSPRRPRVVWAGLHCAGVADLARDIEAALEPLGFPAEERDFDPHITFARIRSPRGVGPLRSALERQAGTEFGSVDVKAITLYRSTLHRDGAVYEALWTIPLAQHK